MIDPLYWKSLNNVLSAKYKYMLEGHQMVPDVKDKLKRQMEENTPGYKTLYRNY